MNCILIVILFVYTIRACNGDVDAEAFANCTEEIKKLYTLPRYFKGCERRKDFAKIAFLNMRDSDDPNRNTFRNVSNNSVYENAKSYYIAIRDGQFIKPTSRSITPEAFCLDNVVPFKTYFDPETGKIINRYTACMLQMDANNIPVLYPIDELLTWIYNNIVIEEIDENTSDFVITYLLNSAIYFTAAYNKCVDEIYDRFEMHQFANDNVKYKHYASIAFLKMRVSNDISLDTFRNETDNSVYEDAKHFYLTILEHRPITLGQYSISPEDFCFNKIGKVKLTVRMGVVKRQETCRGQMLANSIPMSTDILYVLYWIYENIVVEKLDVNTSQFVIEYINYSEKHFKVDHTRLPSPRRFCTKRHTIPDTSINLNLGLQV